MTGGRIIVAARPSPTHERTNSSAFSLLLPYAVTGLADASGGRGLPSSLGPWAARLDMNTKR